MKPVSLAAIVTCHNYGRYLSTCLESLLRQNLPFTEIILVDDASEDSTAEIAGRYKDRGVRYERVNFRNVALSRETGVRLTSSEFLLCVDADDWLVPEFTEMLMKPLLRDPELSFAYSLWIFHFEHPEDAAYVPRRMAPRVHFNPRLLREFNYIDNCSIVRRSAWLGQDPSFSGHLEDWDHWLRIVQRGGRGELVPEKLFYYRMHTRAMDAGLYRSAKEAAKKLIHEKYRFSKYELTLLVLVPEILPEAHPFFSSFAELQVPDSTQRLIVNQTGDRAFHQRLKKLGFPVLSFPHPASRLPGFSDSLKKKESIRSVSRAYRLGRMFVEGRKTLVWTACGLARDAVSSLKDEEKNPQKMAVSQGGTLFLAPSSQLQNIRELGARLGSQAAAAGMTVQELKGPAAEAFSDERPGQLPEERKMARLKVTGVVICHNYGRFLARALDSFLAQTHPFDELILVDDSSTDETFEIWTRYQERVKYLRIDAHSQMAARTAGVRQAQGDLVAFLDADDWVFPDFLKKLYGEYLEDKAETTGAVFCLQETEPAEPGALTAGDEEGKPWNEKELFEGNSIPSALLIRKKAWPDLDRTFGIPVPGAGEYAEDWDVWLSLLRAGWRIRRVRARLCRYFRHPESTTQKILGRGLPHEPMLEKVRTRHLPYDLSIIVFIHAGMFYTQEMLQELKLLAAGQRRQILFVDGSGGGGAAEVLAPYGEKVFYFPEIDFSETAAWKREAVRRFSPEILGRHILLWDSFYALPAAAYEDLASAAAGRECRFVSAWKEPSSCAPEAESGLAGAAGDPFFLLFENRRFSDPGNTFLSKQKTARPVPGAEVWVEEKVVVRPRVVSKHAREMERDWPCVSIVIPVKNSEVQLRELLKSLGNLDYPEACIEILVVDNASSDKTREVVKDFPEVRLLIEPAGGSYAARNCGLWAARFPWVAFLDADCRVTPSWLKELTEAMMQDERIGAVAGDNKPLHPESKISRMERRFLGYSNFSGEDLRPPYGITMNILYRREVFLQCGPFDGACLSGGDVEMSWRMQASGWWRLQVLQGRAVVFHEDVSTLGAWFTRHLRIGSGLFAHYEKYVSFFDGNLRWLPRSTPEILLQAFARIVFESVSALLGKKDTLTFEERLGRLFRITVQKLGYRKSLQHWERRQAPAKESECVLFFGDKPCEPWDASFSFLTGLKKKASVRVLSVDPPRNVRDSWAGFFRFCFGMATVWRWPLGIRSMELWSLLPENPRFPFLARWNRKINRMRIRKNAGILKGAPVKVCGWIPRAELLLWRHTMGEGAALRETLETQFQRISYPSAGCVLKGWENDLDWKTLLEAARLSPWPIWVCLRGKPEDRGHFFEGSFDPVNLKIIFWENLEEAVRFAAKKTAVLFYPLASAAGASVVPEAVHVLLDQGMPLVTTSGQRAGGLRGNVHEASSSPEALRLLRQFQNFPAWNHGTVKAVYQPEGRSLSSV